VSLAAALDMRSGEGAELVLRGATVLDPVAGIDGVHDVVVRNGRIAELATPGGELDGIEEVDAESLGDPLPVAGTEVGGHAEDACSAVEAPVLGGPPAIGRLPEAALVVARRLPRP